MTLPLIDCFPPLLTVQYISSKTWVKYKLRWTVHIIACQSFFWLICENNRGCQVHRSCCMRWKHYSLAGVARHAMHATLHCAFLSSPFYQMLRLAVLSLHINPSFVSSLNLCRGRCLVTVTLIVILQSSTWFYRCYLTNRILCFITTKWKYGYALVLQFLRLSS